MRQTVASRQHKLANVATPSPITPVNDTSKGSKRRSTLASTAVVFLLLFGVCFLYLRRYPVAPFPPPLDGIDNRGSSYNSNFGAAPASPITSVDPAVATTIVATPMASSAGGTSANRMPSPKVTSLFQTKVDSTCSDPVWCTIDIPSESHFAFAPVPSDPARWREAQTLASRGVPVLSRGVRQVFPHPEDFLDGDPFSQAYDHMVDVFMNLDTMFGPLTATVGAVSMTVPQEKLGVSKGFARDIYENSYGDRAPVVQLGSYKYVGKRWVSRSGDNVRSIGLSVFLTEFERVEKEITRPCVLLAALDKDWGFLSEGVSGRVQPPPGRGAGQGQDQDQQSEGGMKHHISKGDKERLLRALDSDKVVMLVVNQHSSVSHPKLLTLPYGLHLDSSFDRKALWDSLNYVLKRGKKTALVYKAENLSSPSRRIAEELLKVIPSTEFLGDLEVSEAAASPQEQRARHYHHVSQATAGLFLPAAGLDAESHWEMLYMGLMGVAERGRGLDKLYWKLPVLLLDDFSGATPSLLRTAYLECLYHRRLLDFSRLRHSFWAAVIFTASQQSSSADMTDKFPVPLSRAVAA